MDILEPYNLGQANTLEWLENYIHNTMPQQQAKMMVKIIKNYKKTLTI